MDIKIRHKLIEIEDRVSDVTRYRWLRILEVIRYRRSNRPILKNTRQIYKFHSFGKSKPNYCTREVLGSYFPDFRPVSFIIIMKALPLLYSLVLDLIL